ncbi:MAG: glutamine synthetase family protein [Acidimicrobiia bacterium]
MADTVARPAGGAVALEALRRQAGGGGIDNVVVAVPDLAGRLQGSRVAVDHFLDEVVARGLPACAYLLASDVEMAAGDGYAFSPRDTGFGDLVLRPDLATLRLPPWDPGAAVVVADAEWPDGSAVEVAPRTVLRRQLDRLAERGLDALAATEVELRVFAEPYRRAWDAGYRGLTPATAFNVDYALGGLGVLDALGADLRAAMAGVGVAFETARGECAPGQYEVTFRYGPALAACDAHVLYKAAAKALAARRGVSVTFMAKFDGAEGSGGHVHVSLRGFDDRPAFAGDGTGDRRGMSPLMARFVAGQLACLPELTLLLAPTVNSYKRLRPGCFAPTAVAWGRDNRTCAVRVVGSGRSLRLEHRVPGADANPYLVLAAVVAAGLHGVDAELELEPAASGDASAQGRPRLPATLEEALGRWSASAVAERAFGPAVVAHLAGAARAELGAFAATVTDWERRRGFERT